MMKALLKIVILLLGFSGMVTVFAATGGPPATEPGSGVTVTVEVFSGRPNPTFTLDDDTVLQGLRRAFSGPPVEPPDGARAAAFGRLGYRGVVIVNERGVEGIPRYVQALDGLLLTRDEPAGAPRYFSDTGSLEQRCLALAAERGLIGELISDGLVPDPSAM